MKKIFILLTGLFCLAGNAHNLTATTATNDIKTLEIGAPTALSYKNPVVLTQGITITTIYPTVTGGTPTRYTVSPALPTGLTVSPTTGKITGKPSVVKAAANYTITASNSYGSTSFAVNITVRPAVTTPTALSYTTPNVFTAGSVISMLSPTVTGGSPTLYTVSPALPSGLSLNQNTGKITGTPTSAKTLATYTVTGSNSAGSRSFGIVITVNGAASTVTAPTSISYTSPNVFTTGSAISTLSPSVSGGTPTSYSVSPALPSGLALNTTNGSISGTPSAAAVQATYTITGSNSAGSKSVGVVITVNSTVIAPSALSYPSPNVFTTGTTIATLAPAVGGGTPTAYSISPSLPAGLSFSTSTGKITGTPVSAASQATYTVTASNSAGSKSFGIVISINSAVTITAPTALSYTSPNIFTAGTAVTGLTPSISGTVTSYSISPALPAGLSISSSTGIISGTPSVAASQSTYTVTASNTAGSVAYGVVITVNAATPPVQTPVTTTSVSYTSLTSNIQNPERGLYRHTETHSASYAALSQSNMTSWRTTNNVTLLLRVFYLEDFVNSAISSTYLSNMQSDFAKVRASGLKIIVRFAYADHNDPGVPHDASKAMVLSHINQLKPILQSNQDVIALVQAGFIGSWGEWYYTDNFGMSPTATDYANRREVVDAILAALPNKMVQLRTPKLKMNTYGTSTALSSAQAYSTANIARVGHHNDCFLASSDDYGTYNNLTTEYPYLEQETKYVPMGGETCAVNAPRSQCATAVAEMAKFHWSFMNMDYHETVLAGFQSSGCYSEMQNRLGYRFELLNATYPTTALLGGSVAISMQMKNSGFATPYNARTAYIVFRNTSTGTEYKVALAANCRLWTAGTNTTIAENISLPTNMPAGSYKMFLALPDMDATLATRPEYSIRLANNNTWETTTGYNDLQHTIVVGNQAGRLASSEVRATDATPLTVYPVPTNAVLNVEMSNVGDYNLSVYNTLGQRMPVNAKIESESQMILDTQSLTNGVYFVTLDNGTTKETKRIIVKH